MGFFYWGEECNPKNREAKEQQEQEPLPSTNVRHYFASYRRPDRGDLGRCAEGTLPGPM
jgi:hypothetical protein